MKSTFDNEYLKTNYGWEYLETWYPYKQQLEDLFSKHGYKNHEVAYLCSYASMKDVKNHYSKYVGLFNLMVDVGRLKCPISLHINDDTRTILLSLLKEKVEAELGYHQNENYYYKAYIINRAKELGWNSFELLLLVQKEMEAANGSGIYSRYVHLHKNDLYASVERTIQYVVTKYPCAPRQVDDDEALIRYMKQQSIGAIETMDAYLYNICIGVFLAEDFLPGEINSFYMPKLERYFKEYVWCNPMRAMMDRYRATFDVQQDYDAKRYYEFLQTYYDALPFLKCGSTSPYVAAQYLYSMITRKPVCDKLPISVGSLICELLVLFGYITIESLDVCSPKEKYDAVKRYLRVDKSTGLYVRLA